MLISQETLKKLAALAEKTDSDELKQLIAILIEEGKQGTEYYRSTD